MSDENYSVCEEAIELLVLGEAEEAVRELSAIIARDPSNEHAYFFMGQALYEQKEYERSLASYVKALELAPHYLGAMIGAGQCLRLLGEHDKALRMGRQILAIRKDDPDALYLLGLVHYQRGENAASQRYLEDFLKTNPEIEIALEVEGILQVLRGEFEPLDDEGVEA